MLKVSFLALTVAVGAFADVVIYDSFTSAPNVPSLGYQATSTREFGAAISLAGTERDLTTISVQMSNWAYASSYAGSGAGFNHELTVNLYEAGPGNTVGSLIGTRTVNAFIPWRPEPGGGCPGTSYLAGDGFCYNGSISQVDFDFTGITVPDQIIATLAFNTQTHGYNPIGVAGPYNSLNFAIGAPISIGSPAGSADIQYWNTTFAGFYADGGAGGVGVLRADTDWSGYNSAFRISAAAAAVPEPGVTVIFSSLAVLLWRGSRLRRSRNAGK